MTMNISRDDAAAALRNVERAQARSLEIRGYRIASPYLFLWGAIWAVGYFLTGMVAEGDIWKVWAAADLIGVVGTVFLGVRSYAAGRKPRRGLRALGAFLAIAAFVVASYTVMRPTSDLQFEVYPALILALVYTLVGLFLLPRFIWIGAAVFVATMAGYVFLQPWINLWLAGAGGGALILGGAWLRRA